MNLVCKECGKEFYISEQDPEPNIEDFYCGECGGDLDYLIELAEDDLPVETGTVVDYENEYDDTDEYEDPKLSMSS